MGLESENVSEVTFYFMNSSKELHCRPQYSLVHLNAFKAPEYAYFIRLADLTNGFKANNLYVTGRQKYLKFKGQCIFLFLKAIILNTNFFFFLHFLFVLFWWWWRALCMSHWNACGGQKTAYRSRFSLSTNGNPRARTQAMRFGGRMSVTTESSHCLLFFLFGLVCFSFSICLCICF